MVIRLPLEPYWHNAVTWWADQHTCGNIADYYQWMANQGVVGLPRAKFTDYLEFANPYEALIFRMKWA